MCYKPWKRRVEKAKKKRFRALDAQRGGGSASVEDPDGVREGNMPAAPDTIEAYVEERRERDGSKPLDL